MATMVTKYFSKEELQCKCGCGIYNVDFSLLKKLDPIRGGYGKKLVVTSCCRCPTWNSKVGGKPDSGHITTDSQASIAIDFLCIYDMDRDNLVKLSYDLGFSGRGISSKFCHFDLKIGDPRMWVY